jgi:hypothetical protein
MEARAQATVEYAGVALLVLMLLLGAARVVGAANTSARPAGDAAYLDLAARHAPLLVLERGDGSVPVDFRHCRSRGCAGSGTPTLFVHGVRRGGYTYLEYWEYEPFSRTAHTGIPGLDGIHADDWEGLIVKLRADGTVVGARASAHLGWNGRHPWWQLAAADWAPYPAPVYRAAGSHAGSFTRGGIDLAGDAWSGDTVAVQPRLVAADQARSARARFDPEAVAPWQKAAWDDPEATITGRPGDRAHYARYARWWARLCLPCGLLGD